MSKESLLIPVPNVGEGHQLAGIGVMHALKNASSSELLVINNGANKIAQIKHSSLTKDAQIATNYIETADEERSGSLGSLFVADTKIVLNKYQESNPTIITPQDHIAQAAIQLGFETHLYVIDTHTKSDISATPLLNFLVWNLSALEKIVEENSQARVSLINPVSLTYPHKEVVPLETQQIIISLSGSGADPDVIKPLIASLSKESENIMIATNNSSHAKSVIIEPAERMTKYEYLSSLRTDIPHTVICFASENVHILANESPRKIAFLYPRGPHEVDNLVWAIKQGLSNTVIVPTHLQGKVSEAISKRGLLPEEYKIVGPSNLSLSSLEVSQKWTQSGKRVNIVEAIN